MLHARLEKLNPVLGQLPEIVRRLDHFSALMIQPSQAHSSQIAESVRFFLVAQGCIADPITFCIQPAEHAKSQSMESRIQEVLKAVPATKKQAALETMEHLALLKRWYFRGSRLGEIFFADERGTLPLRRIVRGIGRVLKGEREPALSVGTTPLVQIDNGIPRP